MAAGVMIIKRKEVSWMNQREKVMQYLNDFGSITPMEALSEFGIMRLAARVNELTKMGVPIVSVIEKSRNRYGQTVRYARYSLMV